MPVHMVESKTYEEICHVFTSTVKFWPQLCYPVDNTIGFAYAYPLDSDLSIHLLNNRGQITPLMRGNTIIIKYF